MSRLDRVLRTAGSAVLIEPSTACALIARLKTDRPMHRAGLLQRTMRAVGIGGSEEADLTAIDRSQQPMAAVTWSTAKVEYCAGYVLADEVAVISVCDVLTPDGYYDWWSDQWFGGYAQIGAAFRAARADDRVKGIFLCIDSPGGLVDGCFELVDEIREGSARSGGKPVWAHATMACSAAYAIASACDRVVAPATAYVGSIGVFMVHVDETAWLEKLGLKITPIQSGERKTDFQPFKPLDDAARANAQSDIDETLRIFVSAVVAGRGLDAEQIVAQQGDSYMARHSNPERSGIDLKLVDAIGSERGTAAELIELVNMASVPAGSPAINPAAPASRGAKEITMSLKERLAAVLAEDDADDKLAKIKSILDGEEDKDEDEGDGTEASAADEDTDKDGDAAAKGGRKTSASDGFAVLDLPEAKGREELAKSLARKVGAGALSLKDAKDLLAAAPKASRLSEAMAGKDHNPGPGDAGTADGAGLSAAVDRLNAKTKR